MDKKPKKSSKLSHSDKQGRRHISSGELLRLRVARRGGNQEFLASVERQRKSKQVHDRDSAKPESEREADESASDEVVGDDCDSE